MFRHPQWRVLPNESDHTQRFAFVLQCQFHDGTVDPPGFWSTPLSAREHGSYSISPPTFGPPPGRTAPPTGTLRTTTSSCPTRAGTNAARRGQGASTRALCRAIRAHAPSVILPKKCIAFAVQPSPYHPYRICVPSAWDNQLYGLLLLSPHTPYSRILRMHANIGRRVLVFSLPHTVRHEFPGRRSETVACANTEPQSGCEAVCGRTLACGKHTCTQLCHAGECDPCQVQHLEVCPNQEQR